MPDRLNAYALMPAHYARASYACQCLIWILLDLFQALRAGIGKMRLFGGEAMRGEKVIARAFGGVPVVLRVWEVGHGVVYLASEAEFEKREAGKPALEPVGFPARDVFVYEEAFLTDNSARDWRKLRLWRQVRLLAQA